MQDWVTVTVVTIQDISRNLRVIYFNRELPGNHISYFTFAHWRTFCGPNNLILICRDCQLWRRSILHPMESKQSPG